MKGVFTALLRWVNLHPLWRRGRVAVWGHRLRPPTADRWLALTLHRLRLMGTADRAFLSREIKPGMTVVDIGANQGLYSLLFSSLVGEAGRVVSFEPDDLLYAALADNVGHNAPQVQTHHLALGSQPGEMTLYRSLLNSGDNRLAPGAAASGAREEVRIRVERLDRVLAGARVDFIKLDVQGWEVEVFRGMQSLLDDPANRQMSIYFEYWPQGLRDAGSNPLEPLAFLAANGFAVRRTDGGRAGVPVEDAAAFAASVKPSAYINLYAVRA